MMLNWSQDDSNNLADTEAIPLAATAILPMILYPLTGILEGKATAPIYFNSTIFLFIGGFMIALTREKWDLHKRLALVTIRTIGGGPSRIVLGFMVASAFLSAWMAMLGNQAQSINRFRLESNVLCSVSPRRLVALILLMQYSPAFFIFISGSFQDGHDLGSKPLG
jgi:di/tricarboxylate transporter